jgi:glutamyl-tRNA synthetase
MTFLDQPLRTRFAPSPTGFLHIGGARTALFAWLAARHTQGQFILRIEDTDRERSTQESVDAILDGMHWLGLDYDEGPYFQSDRLARYQSVVNELLEQGMAYRCYCSKSRLEALREKAIAAGEKPRYDGLCRDEPAVVDDIEPVIRFKNPVHGSVEFNDHVYGPICVENNELDDLVIMRADGTPTYNFAVVVDDLDMGINLVLRGDDHINNTPRQINLYHALGATPPEFAHVPMILGADGQRYSKRHGAMGVMGWREQGFVPSAMINYLARLGWSHGDQEIFSRDELIELFRVSDINRKASRFDTEKLTWVNHHYLRQGETAELVCELEWHVHRLGFPLEQGPRLDALLSVQAERIATMSELAQQSQAFFVDFEDYEPKAASKHLNEGARDALTAALVRLERQADWIPDALQQALEQTSAELGVSFGKIGMPLRVALVGHGQSPSINQTLWLLGKSKSLARIQRAIQWIENQAQHVAE